MEEEEAKKLVVEETSKAFLKEIILENFMSYKYARIPLEAGLNIICGPNGSGKSSILLALSVTLGQIYTERSRKLSGLIRWGEDLARITLLFNNTPIKGKRPVAGCSSDTFMLSRYLRKDGTYWYEADYREISKNEVIKILSNLGINPDNMLIIMHQNMVEEFSVIPPNKKLEMLEEAVGFQAYRQRILEAQERLNQVLNEESSVLKLLSNAEQTLQYWEEQYEKYLRKKELTEKKEYLECELAWAYVLKVEKSLESINRELEKKQLKLDSVVDEIAKIKKDIEKIYQTILNLKSEENKTFRDLLKIEKEKSAIEAKLEIINKIFVEIDRLKEKYGKISGLIEELKGQTKILGQKNGQLLGEIEKLEQKLKGIKGKLDSAHKEYVDKKVKEALLNFRRDNLEEDIGKLVKEIEKLKEELEQKVLEAEKVGLRVETQRSIQEIVDELRFVNIQLANMDVSDEAERMYRKYLRIYEELKQKSLIVAENKRRMLAEVEVRKQTWRKIVKDFLGELNQTYKSTLEIVGATGEIRLIEKENIENAGLEILAGFHGLPPTTLDSQTHSGGERTTAIMAFLLSLQKHVKSPIRAVDEFDVHMDPRNREIVYRLIVSTVKAQPETQYIVITPGQLTLFDEKTNVILVQNVGGRSETKTVSRLGVES